MESPKQTARDTAELPQLDITVYRDLEAIGPLWTAFQAKAHGTLYQSAIWCRAWFETAGANQNITPLIIVATGQRQQVQFMLPLQVRRQWGVRVLEWLGSPHNNYGCGLYHPDFLGLARRWFDDNWPELMATAGPYDAIALSDMPDRLNGIGNPMAGIFNLRGANRSYAMRLSADFAAMYKEQRSAGDRRSARKKENGLAQAGAITFGLPDGKDALHGVLDTMFEQQENRLAERGVHDVFGPAERAFIHRIADLQDERDPVLAPYELKCGGETLAVMLGGIFGGTYWALISSLAATDLRRYSPGDIALRRTIEACCQRGLNSFDFSAGTSRYKKSWAGEVIQLHCHLGARNLRGLALTSAIAIKQVLKRRIKETPLVLALANSMRRGLRGRKTA